MIIMMMMIIIIIKIVIIININNNAVRKKEKYLNLIKEMSRNLTDVWNLQISPWAPLAFSPTNAPRS